MQDDHFRLLRRGRVAAGAKKKFTVITEEDLRLVVERESNAERKLFYEMLWETGGSQADIAGLHADQINPEAEAMRFRRKKPDGKESGGESLLRIGPSLRELLNQLLQNGYLFPNLQAWDSKNRSSEFCRRCKMWAYPAVFILTATPGRSVPAPPGCRSAKP